MSAERLLWVSHGWGRQVRAGDASCVSWDSGRSTRPGTGKSFRRSKPCACVKSHRERGFYLWWNVLTRSHVEQVHGLTSASVKALFSLLEQIYNRPVTLFVNFPSYSFCSCCSLYLRFPPCFYWHCNIHSYIQSYRNVLLFMDHYNNVKFWISSIFGHF